MLRIIIVLVARLNRIKLWFVPLLYVSITNLKENGENVFSWYWFQEAKKLVSVHTLLKVKYDICENETRFTHKCGN